MAGYKLVTDLDPERSLQTAWRTAQDLGFRLSPVADGSFEATKGNALLRFVAGPLTTYCDFKFSASSYPDGTTDLVLETNSPWLTTGAIGARRVRGQAEQLIDQIAEAVKQGGGRVIERKEIP